jgi:hypothetical protein
MSMIKKPSDPVVSRKDQPQRVDQPSERVSPAGIDQRQQQIDPAGRHRVDDNARPDSNRKQPGGSHRRLPS